MNQPKSNYIGLLILFLVFNSCTGHQKGTDQNPEFIIDIRDAISNKPNKTNMSNLVKNFTFIPLETTDNSLVRSIRKVILYKDYIFVTDRKSVYQFTDTGSFIRKIGKAGKGPGEHSNRISFTINPDKGEVLIFSSGTNQINFHDLESGSFKNSKTLPSDFYDIEMITDEYLAGLTYELRAEYALNSIVEIFIFDNDGELIDSIINYNRKNYKGNSAGFPVHYTKNNSLNYIYNYRDTLYRINENLTKFPYVHFEFNNMISGDELTIKPDPDQIQFHDHLMIEKVLETEKYLFVSLYKGIDLSFSGKNIHYLLFDKTDSNISYIIKSDSLLSNKPDFWPKWVSGEKLISLLSAQEFLTLYEENGESNIDKYLIKDLPEKFDEYSNPVIVIAD